MSSEIGATGTKHVADNTAATFKFACPHCGQHLEAEPDWVGMEVECPSCGKAIIVPQPQPSTPVITVVEKPKLTRISECALENGGNLSWWKKIPKWEYGVAGAAVLVVIGFVGTRLIRREAIDIGPARTEATDSTEQSRRSKKTHSSSPHTRAVASAESLCSEFINGGNSYQRKDGPGKFWTSFGVPFERTGKTTVRWRMGSDTPPSICMVEFKNDGTALVTEDNTFFAREFRRNSLSEIANALQRAFELMNHDLDYVVSVTTRVTDDGRIIFSALVRVSSGSVSDTIGNTLFGMAKCRTFLRM